MKGGKHKPSKSDNGVSASSETNHLESNESNGSKKDSKKLFASTGENASIAKPGLASRISAHLDGKPVGRTYHCELCGLSFSTSTNRNRHLRSSQQHKMLLELSERGEETASIEDDKREGGLKAEEPSSDDEVQIIYKKIFFLFIAL